MYNRYVPMPDGTYRRDRIETPQSYPKEPQPQYHSPPPPPPPPKAPEPPQPPPVFREPRTGGIHFLRRLLPDNLDTGDMIVILLLLLMAGDSQEDRTNALLTLAVYLLM